MPPYFFDDPSCLENFNHISFRRMADSAIFFSDIKNRSYLFWMNGFDKTDRNRGEEIYWGSS